MTNLSLRNTYSRHTHTRTHARTVGLCAEPGHKGYHNSGFEVGAEAWTVLSQARQGERSYVRNAQNQTIKEKRLQVLDELALTVCSLLVFTFKPFS